MKSKIKIVAIGGGEIADGETLSIDKETLELTNKKNPRLLFIPTASTDSDEYCLLIRKYFISLECEAVDFLKVIGKDFTDGELDGILSNYDVVYVGGGNTQLLIQEWKRIGLDNALIKASTSSGLVLSGISAGSICWFKYGNSDSEIITGTSNDLIRVAGLGIVPALHCPHYNTQIKRQRDLKEMMSHNTDLVSIALDDCSAIEIVGEQYRILKSRKSAKARKIYWIKDQYRIEEIPASNDFRSLEDLLTIPTSD